MIRFASAASAGILLALAAAAQAPSPSSVAIPQIAPNGAGASASSSVHVPAIEPGRRPDAAAAPAQVGNGARSATAAAPLSTPADGRVVRLAPLTGQDSCETDPALARTELCRQRIETRANSYTAPAAAPVTAEGRLMVLIAPGGSDTSADPARRLGETGPNLQDFVGQAAGQVAAALGQGVPATGGSADSSPFQTPGGLPSTVLINPGR